MDRRAALKTMVSGGVGVATFAAVQRPGMLEAAVDSAYKISHAAYVELGAVVERKLEASLNRAERFIGKLQDERKIMSNYWGHVGLVTQEEYTRLTAAIDRAQKYVDDATLKERFTRFTDRSIEALLTIDAEGEKITTPESVRKGWDEKLAQKKDSMVNYVKGLFGSKPTRDTSDPRVALERYRERIRNLVKVYDFSRDSLMAQQHEFNNVADYFRQAQRTVVARIDEYLKSGEMRSTEEKQYFLDLKELAKEDPSGRKMADYMVGTKNYFTALEAQRYVKEFSDGIKNAIGHLEDLQDIKDKADLLRNKYRAGEKGYQSLVASTRDLEKAITEKKEELRAEGEQIEYDPAPGMTEAFDYLKGKLSTSRTVVATLAGVLAAYGIHKVLSTVPGMRSDTVQVNRKVFQGLRRDAEEFRSQGEH